ncbi:alpha/beta hydrolase [uncultured Jannaschia sp.]|uniref:alpha/beta hydrolase n=1 Tax=uncultured Jannaschia sp. TaxID=293347 RepID=UPI002612EB77|nr:alpha/beta hydrolase [uncultured Jannaschia sp.]
MKGWRDMGAAELDAAYANADHIEGAERFPPRWAAEARRFRARAVAELDRAAPTGAGYDLFLPANEAAGLVVFVHGGYWRAFGKSDWSHLAAGAVATGHAAAIVGYPLAPGARLSEITRHVARAIDHVAGRVGGPIRLAGHSAGGHLVLRMVMPDAAPDCVGRIATCVPISPLADLRPLLRSSMNADLCLDADEAVVESPVLGRPLPGPRVAVHVGAAERPSFRWQAETLAAEWGVPLRIVPERHHFDVIDDLLDPESALMRDVLHGPRAEAV